MKKTLMLLLLVSSALYAGADLSTATGYNDRYRFKDDLSNDRYRFKDDLKEANSQRAAALARPALATPVIPGRPDLKILVQLFQQIRNSDDTMLSDSSYTFTQGNDEPAKHVGVSGNRTSDEVSLGTILVDWKKRQADVEYRVGNNEFERCIVPIVPTLTLGSYGKDPIIMRPFRDDLYVEITASTRIAYPNQTLPALKPHNKNLAKLILMVRLMDENHGIFCSKNISYALDDKNAVTYTDSEKDISDISNNPIATAKNERQTQAFRSKASEYIYDIHLALLAMGMNRRNEKTATVEYSITKHSKTSSALIQPPKEMTLKLQKTCLNGYREMVQCEGEAPFSLLIRTKEL